MNSEQLAVAFFDTLTNSRYGKPKLNDVAGLVYTETNDKDLQIKVDITCGEGNIVSVIKTSDTFTVVIPKQVRSVLKIDNPKKLSNYQIAQILGHQYPNIGELYYAERSTS